MEFAEVERVLDELESRRVRYWVAGGWGVAVLVGAQSREHRDLDLLVEDSGVDACLEGLERLGYRRETDWLPVRVEYAAPGRGWVDVHPVAFDANGDGRQEGLDGTWFDYPADCLTTGTLCGRVIPTLSEARQREAHAGYELRPQDTHDLAQLDSLAD